MIATAILQVVTAKAIIAAEGVISGMVGEGKFVGFWVKFGLGEGDWEGNRLWEGVDEGEREGDVQAGNEGAAEGERDSVGCDEREGGGD